MSHLTGDDGNKRYKIIGEGVCTQERQKNLVTEFLGEIPIDS